MKNGRNIRGTQIVRDTGLGEYEQRFLISRDEYGATFIHSSAMRRSFQVLERTRVQDKVAD
jgi:hypothetical protein